VKRLIQTLCVALALCALALANAYYRSITQPNEKQFKLGVLLCLTGPCAEWGNNALNGIKLAQTEINARGGILGRTLEVVVQDSAEQTPSAAVTAFQNLLLDPQIRYVIGPTWTPAALAIGPLAKKRKSLLITSPSAGVGDFNEMGSNIFNVWPHDEVSTRKVARYAIRQGWMQAAIFSSQQPWEKLQGDTFEQEFTKLGGVVTAKVEPLDTATNLKSEALTVVHSQPDVVFFANFQSMGVAAKELQVLQYSGHKLAILMDKTRIETAQNGLEDTIFALYPEASSSFRIRYERAYGEKPGNSADTGYDTVMLYAHAIEQAQTTDVGAIRKILRTTKDFAGASGTITFDAKGGVIKDPPLWRVSGLDYSLLP